MTLPRSYSISAPVHILKYGTHYPCGIIRENQSSHGMIGQTIGHHKILEQLGAGRMDIVYKALGTHLDRFVAIKVLPPEKVA